MRGLRLLSLGALLLGGLVSVAAQAVPKSYPMVCRGGGGTLGYNAEAPYRNALFYFEKASHASGNGLAAGQCAWVDRAIGPNEPTCLKQQNVSASAWMFPGQMSNNYFASTGAPWMRNLLKSANFQTFQVYNPGNTDCFIVTRLGN